MYYRTACVCNSCGHKIVFHSAADGYEDASVWFTDGSHTEDKYVENCPNCGQILHSSTLTTMEEWREIVSCNTCGLEYKASFEGSDFGFEARGFYKPGTHNQLEKCTLCGTKLSFETTSHVRPVD